MRQPKRLPELDMSPLFRQDRPESWTVLPNLHAPTTVGPDCDAEAGW